MRIALLQHVAFEGPGAIGDWASLRGHELAIQRVDQAGPPERLDGLGGAIVMGGPMGANDEEVYPWLASEKRFIADVARAGQPVLGICLGAQLLANVLGAPVQRNAHREIGWYPIEWNGAARALPVFEHVPESSIVFHWHGDTFDVPAGMVAVAASEACARQGFASADGRIVGLQFHLEMRPVDVRALIRHGNADLASGGRYVQGAEQLLLASAEHGPALQALLFRLLDRWADTALPLPRS